MAFVDEGIDQRAEVSRGATDSLTYWVRSNLQLIVPDVNSAYVTITDPAGSALVPRTQVGVTVGVNGQIVYSRSWDSTTYQLYEDYSALVECTLLGVAFSDRLWFDVVLTKLTCPLDVNNLLQVYPDLIEHLKALGETGPEKFIKRAWSKFLDRIRSGKNRPSLIMDRARLVNPSLELSLYYVCRALSRDVGDLWHDRKVEHGKSYGELVAGLGDLKYDRNEDGLISENEVKQINRRMFSV